MTAFKQGISHEKALKKDKIWGHIKKIPGLVFFYFLVKNQIWPLVKPYVKDHLPKRF